MKLLNEMDLDDEWELIPEEGFLEINDDGGKKIYSRKYNAPNNSSSKSVFQMNHFICPPPSPQLTGGHPPPPNTYTVPVLDHQQPLLPIVDLQPPTTLNPTKKRAPPGQLDDETMKKIHIPPPQPVAASDHEKCLSDPDPAAVSQVFFFKKMKETEFADMKVMDSPKSGFSRGVVAFEETAADPASSSACKVEENNNKQQIVMDLKLEEREGEGSSSAGGGVNIWKKGLNGIGAICSFGVAAATVCVIIFGRKNIKHHHNLHFQLYTTSTDKRMKQVVEQASMLNEAISAMRGRGQGVPITTAHVTFGGYYDAAAAATAAAASL